MLVQSKVIQEQDAMKFQVVVDGRVMNESPTMNLAESFVASLTIEQRSKAQIIPVTSEGKQVLLG